MVLRTWWNVKTFKFSEELDRIPFSNSHMLVSIYNLVCFNMNCRYATCLHFNVIVSTHFVLISILTSLPWMLSRCLVYRINNCIDRQYISWIASWLSQCFLPLPDTKVYGDGIPAVIGGAAIVSKLDDIYVVAGFNSLSHGTVTRLRLPPDLCRLQTVAETCLNQSGCMACTDHLTNTTYCYGIDSAVPTQYVAQKQLKSFS